MNNFLGKKRTCDTCKNKAEDELHFLLEYPLNEEIRHNFLQKMIKLQQKISNPGVTRIK